MGLILALAALYQIAVGGAEIWQVEANGSAPSFVSNVSGLPTVGSLVGGTNPTTTTPGFIDVAIGFAIFILIGTFGGRR